MTNTLLSTPAYIYARSARIDLPIGVVQYHMWNLVKDGRFEDYRSGRYTEKMRCILQRWNDGHLVVEAGGGQAARLLPAGQTLVCRTWKPQLWGFRLNCALADEQTGRLGHGSSLVQSRWQVLPIDRRCIKDRRFYANILTDF